MPNSVNHVGVISFPRSGNTWVRHILANLFFGGDFGKVPGLHKNRLADAEVAETKTGRYIFYKTHEANPQTPVSKVLFIYRHPLDAFLSYLNYMSIRNWPFGLKARSVDEFHKRGELDIFFNVFLAFCTLDGRRSRAWDTHITRYLNQPRAEVIPIKYEALTQNPMQALEGFRNAFGLSRTELEIAITAASAKTALDGKFYWKQTVGLHKDYLKDEQIEQFSSCYSEAMRLAGYA